jgi:hypothetical protein
MRGNARLVAEPAADTEVFVEPTAQGRLTTQRGLFAGPSPLVSKGLLLRTWGSVVREHASVSLEPATRASLRALSMPPSPAFGLGGEGDFLPSNARKVPFTPPQSSRAYLPLRDP